MNVSHHGLHPRPALLLIFSSLHVLQVLASFGKRLQEGVEDAEELVRLHPALLLTEVLHRFGELPRDTHLPPLFREFPV